MNKRRLISALVAAICAGVIWFVYQRRFVVESSGGEKIKILVANRDIDRGQVIADDALEAREVPQAYVEDRAIKDIERPKVVGLRMGIGLRPKQTLMWTDVITPAEEETQALGAKIPPGVRAVPLRTSIDDATSAMIHPGDYVDLIGVMGSPRETTDTRTSVVLLQRVLVLAVGQKTSRGAPLDDVTPKNAGAVHDYDMMLSLALTLPQAQALQIASEKGRITVALRNPKDPRTFDRPATLSASVLLDSNQREDIRGVRHGVSTRPLE